ncbi:hypothetical protein [Bacillus taeanensis]|uniref:Protein kinase domain-containing protein n=1 Tax=Bacillus taeanensis TaxID=273032 RepID=A0A366XYX3_9BACI|nr:hypothetical protein [Bacillus taeanensis]RBW69959.1 hypothetical protein DS031_08885 [Bacillus taeanensis]
MKIKDHNNDLNYKELQKNITKISVKVLENKDVEVVNNSSLSMIGKGRQGAVFKVTEDICVKVYGDSEDCEREYYALSLGKDKPLFPKVYCKDKNFIAMEFVKGIDLREYLLSQPLTKELSYKLIDMLIIFKKIGFERIDHHKRQIYLQLDGHLKVIDVCRSVWRNRIYPYPRKLLNSLGEKNKKLFLEHVQEMAPKLYQEWKHYMDLEDTALNCLETLSNKKIPESDTIKTAVKPLLTKENPNDYYSKIEDLIQKVYKEHWVKQAIANGMEPELLKKKIKKFLQKHDDFNKLFEENDSKKNKKKDKKKNKHKEIEKICKQDNNPNFVYLSTRLSFRKRRYQ